MYHFVGRLLVLQPDDDLSWVHPGEGQHPLLPPKSGLYELIEPDMLSRTRQLALSSMDALDSLLDSESQGRPASAGTHPGAPGSTGAGFLPSAWPRRRGGVAGSMRRRATGGSTAASAAADATCNAVEGYPSPCSQPLAATAALGRQAYWQSLSPTAVTLDLEERLGPDLTALLSPFTDRNTFSSSSPGSGPSVPPSVPYSSMDEPDGVPLGGTVHTSKPSGNSTPLVRTRNTLHHAELAMLDTPHPLKVLADPSAYGDHGKISRFHHPDHYTQVCSPIHVDSASGFSDCTMFLLPGVAMLKSSSVHRAVHDSSHTCPLRKRRKIQVYQLCREHAGPWISGALKPCPIPAGCRQG